MADDLLQRGARMIERVRSTQMAHTVSFTHGAKDPIEISATADDYEQRIDDEAQFGSVHRLRAFLFASADLTIDAQAFRPAVGDLVTETIDGTATVYEVIVDGDGPAWGYDDILNARVRVVTRRKGAA